MGSPQFERGDPVKPLRATCGGSGIALGGAAQAPPDEPAHTPFDRSCPGRRRQDALNLSSSIPFTREVEKDLRLFPQRRTDLFRFSFYVDFFQDETRHGNLSASLFFIGSKSRRAFTLAPPEMERPEA